MSKVTSEFVETMKNLNGNASLSDIAEMAMDLYRWSKCEDYWLIADELEDIVEQTA